MRTQMHFPASSSPLYLLADDVSVLTLIDQMSARQAQLQALLAMTCGAQADGFRRLNPSYQDNYLWACSMLAEELRELGEALQARGVA
ncbi:MAG: hypothetical protein JSS57_21765 [Proteobacteria bacterium]|nr:hypothetical protein [Pseudomonadota bacterium]